MPGIIKERLFTPGPTPLLMEAQLRALTMTLHHRTDAFRGLMRETLDNLRYYFNTQNDVIIFASSGTGAMEGAVSNLLSPGDRVLIGTAGKFGERWVQLAKAYGIESVVVEVPYGQTVPIGEMKKHLESSGPFRAVFIQATESSTGVRNDVETLGKAVSALPETCFVVDAITGLGTTHLDVDGWGVDVIIGGSQKALMMPPGLGYCAVSERAWKRMETTTSPRFYFDLRKERRSAAKGETAYTPATSLFAALGAALEFIRGMGKGDLAKGREELVNNAELCAEMTRAGAKALGLKLYASAPAAALTAICAPDGVDSSKIVKQFRESFDAVVANGQGEMKGQLFRIAHIGYYDYLDTVGILGALEHVLARLTDKSIEYGAAVRAAQQVYAASTEPAVSTR